LADYFDELIKMQIFRVLFHESRILENHINSGKKNTGRTGMDLWSIFVLAHGRLCLNLSYDVLHEQANNHHNMRCLMGVDKRYIGLGVCAYNLKKIGKQILKSEREALEAATRPVRIAA
jgi:hypothetical protein